MTNESKTLLLTTLHNISSGRYGEVNVHRLYQIFCDEKLEDFQPDFTNDLDKKLVNTIFGKLIQCLFSGRFLDYTYRHNRFFSLSEFKFRSSKLLNHISHFINIEMIPYFKDKDLYLKITVADKLRYYKFDGTNFEEIKSNVYSDWLEQFGSNTDTSLKFLTLTEME